MATLEQVNPRPISAAAKAEEAIKVMTVRRLMWVRFKRNRLAVFGGIVLLLMYLSAIFAGFLAPYAMDTSDAKFISTGPQPLHFVDADGSFHIVPFVYGMKSTVDKKTFKKVVEPDTSQIFPLRFWVHGDKYKLFGVIDTDVHLFGVDAPAKLFLFGTDPSGRDMLSRILYGGQISLFVGLLGVVLTLIYGTIIGIASAYFGGLFDEIVQRIIELLQAFPTLPLWLALATLIPPTWPSDRIHFAISIVLSVVSWGALARQTRSMVFALRESDFVTAARYSNCSNWRIITRHLLPNTLSHIIVIATTSIPGMILGETALSFLGLGIRPPLVSWGLLLNNTQETRVLLQQPWLLIPIVFVVITIISFNFLGDGIRDAADPFAK